MSITEYILEKDRNLLLHNEGVWIGSHSRYSSFSSSGVEVEVGEFLYSMVRILKPEYILETGTCEGISASYMGLGILENKIGHLDTFEISHDLQKKSLVRLKKLGLQGVVLCHLKDADDHQPRYSYDLMFLDTEPSRRLQEAVSFQRHLNPGGYMFVHDMPYTLCKGNVNPDHPDFLNWPIGEVPKRLIELVREDALRPFFFPNQRGMLGFYKPKDEEFNWKL